MLQAATLCTAGALRSAIKTPATGATGLGEHLVALAEVQALLEGVDYSTAAKGINKGDDEGNSAMHWASRKGFAKVVQLLVERGGQVDVVNNEGSSPLHKAARNDHAAVVGLLLEHGATRDLANERGSTAMDYARFLGMHAVIAMLEPDLRVRKLAAMMARRSADDAAAKAQLAANRERELQARTATAKSGLGRGRLSPCIPMLAVTMLTQAVTIRIQVRRADSKSRLEANGSKGSFLKRRDSAGSPPKGGGAGFKASGSPQKGGGAGFKASGSPQKGGGACFKASDSPQKGGGASVKPSDSPQKGGGAGVKLSDSPQKSGGGGFKASGSPQKGGGAGLKPNGSPQKGSGARFWPSDTPVGAKQSPPQPKSPVGRRPPTTVPRSGVLVSDSTLYGFSPVEREKQKEREKEKEKEAEKEARRSKGRREAEAQLKKVLEPLATVRPLTTTDAVQVGT